MMVGWCSCGWLSGGWPRCSTTLAQGGAACRLQPAGAAQDVNVTGLCASGVRAWAPVAQAQIESGEQIAATNRDGTRLGGRMDEYMSRLGTNPCRLNITNTTNTTNTTRRRFHNPYPRTGLTSPPDAQYPEIHVAFYGNTPPRRLPLSSSSIDRASSPSIWGPLRPSAALRPPPSLGRRVGAPQLRVMSRLYRSFQALFGPAGMASRLQSGQTVRIERVKIRKGKPTTRFL